MKQSEEFQVDRILHDVASGTLEIAENRQHAENIQRYAEYYAKAYSWVPTELVVFGPEEAKHVARLLDRVVRSYNNVVKNLSAAVEENRLQDIFKDIDAKLRIVHEMTAFSGYNLPAATLAHETADALARKRKKKESRMMYAIASQWYVQEKHGLETSTVEKAELAIKTAKKSGDIETIKNAVWYLMEDVYPEADICLTLEEEGIHISRLLDPGMAITVLEQLADEHPGFLGYARAGYIAANQDNAEKAKELFGKQCDAGVYDEEGFENANVYLRAGRLADAFRSAICCDAPSERLAAEIAEEMGRKDIVQLMEDAKRLSEKHPHNLPEEEYRQWCHLAGTALHLIGKESEARELLDEATK